MTWVPSAIVVLMTIGSVYPQCFTLNDDFESTSYSTDLSSITDFGLDLFKLLSPKSSKNFFFSPYSIWNALTLAYFGSAGNTQNQLENVLRVSDKISTIKLYKALDKLYEQRKLSAEDYVFDLANRAYFLENIQLRSCVENLLKNELRFLSSSDVMASVRDINNFVSETTRGRITEIVDKNAIASARMVLVNAAYFKGTWKYQFSPSKTYQSDFSINAETSLPVTMMTTKEYFRYGESAQLGARVLELPYSGETMSMYLLLPSSDKPTKNALANMVKNLNGATLREAISDQYLSETEVRVHLPKFKVELELQSELTQALQDLGIVDLFDGSLSNMTTFTPYGNLPISGVIHKSFVEVNEEGTEAAAATVLVHRYALLEPLPPINFKCNQPFVYIIVDKQTSNVLFMGSFTKPTIS